MTASAGGPGLSRREFAKRAGMGSAAAAGLVWAAPKITTIRYARRAAVGSPSPTIDTTAGPAGPLRAQILLSTSSPCVGASFDVTASGFAPKTAVTIELDSAAHPIGLTTADMTGAILLPVTVPATGPTGAHTLRASGTKPGGATLILVAPIIVKTQAECSTAVGPAGKTVIPAGTTTTTTSDTTESPAVGALGVGADSGSSGGSLPFTGGNATDLALMGGAAVLGGRAIYGMAKRHAEEIDGTET